MLHVLRSPMLRASRISFVAVVALAVVAGTQPVWAAPHGAVGTGTFEEILETTIEDVTEAAVGSIPLAQPQHVDRDTKSTPVPPALAAVDGVELRVPSRQPRILGFHEAASPTSRELRPAPSPLGRTLPSRGRGTPQRSAVDVAVAPNTPVLAPVSGKVTEASSYALYGRYPDEMVHLVPDSNPNRVVKVLHVTGARVAVGDRVEAGKTVIAGQSTQFPFVSQVEGEAGRVPHVHIEVQPR